VNTRHLRASDLVGRRWRGLVRESTERQADNWSPERQRADLRRSAVELELVGVEPLFYERVGSGETEGATELAQALADGKRGEYDVLLVLHTSRFARNRLEAARMKAEFRKAGIVIYFVAQRLISGTYAGGLTEGISEVIDEQENETRRMWIAGGQRQRQLSGRWLGVVPFGYRKVMVDREDGSRGWAGALEPDPEQAPVVRDIFDRAARGEGTKTIVVALNAAGHRTATGRPWRRGAVDAILSNPIYAGRLVRYRARLTGHYYEHESDDGHVDLGERFPAVVEPALFDEVRRVRQARNPVPGRYPTRTYPLSRVLRCRRCGGRMTGVTGSNARYYRCSQRAVYKTCDAPGIRADVAEEAFAHWLGSHRLPADWRTAIARTRVEAIGSGERDRRRALEGQLTRLKDLYQLGDVEKDEYLRKSSELKASMGVLAMPSMPGIESVAAALEEVGPAWLQAPAELQAAIPPLMLKAAEVENGRIAAFVVDAGLRPLLELCVPQRVSL
jgi:site-specific DNA recombinase